MFAFPLSFTSMDLIADKDDVWNTFANWLDITWFAYNLKLEDLMKKAQVFPSFLSCFVSSF